MLPALQSFGVHGAVIFASEYLERIGEDSSILPQARDPSLYKHLRVATPGDRGGSAESVNLSLGSWNGAPEGLNHRE